MDVWCLWAEEEEETFVMWLDTRKERLVYGCMQAEGSSSHRRRIVEEGAVVESCEGAVGK